MSYLVKGSLEKIFKKNSDVDDEYDEEYDVKLRLFEISLFNRSA